MKSDGGCETLKGLGVCLTELVTKPLANSTTGPDGPAPSITGISDPTVVQVKENKLQWWQILLMVFGGLFCGLVVLVLWRRHARKKRMQRTRAWATTRGVLGGKSPWWKRVFGRREQNGFGGRMEKEEGLPRYRDEVVSEHPESTVDGFIDAYADERSSWEYRSSVASRSLFSEITGERRRAPEPRALVRERSISVKSLRTTKSVPRSTKSSERKLVDVETEAEKYARSVREKPAPDVGRADEHPGVAPFLATEPFRIQPTATGSSSSSQSRNPFRKNIDTY